MIWRKKVIEDVLVKIKVGKFYYANIWYVELIVKKRDHYTVITLGEFAKEEEAKQFAHDFKVYRE